MIVFVMPYVAKEDLIAPSRKSHYHRNCFLGILNNRKQLHFVHVWKSSVGASFEYLQKQRENPSHILHPMHLCNDMLKCARFVSSWDLHFRSSLAHKSLIKGILLAFLLTRIQYLRESSLSRLELPRQKGCRRKGRHNSWFADNMRGCSQSCGRNSGWSSCWDAQ